MLPSYSTLSCLWQITINLNDINFCCLVVVHRLPLLITNVNCMATFFVIFEIIVDLLD
jgi:hypothetical protein